jgi:hypothetical protein
MSYMDLIPGNYSNAPTDMEQAARKVLASEPTIKHGLSTPMRPDGDRTIKYTWQIGVGDLWKNADQYLAESERVPFFAVLTVTHHKKGRLRANYSATLWQHHGEGASMCAVDGRNGTMIERDFNGAGRFSLARLQAFAPMALAKLRERASEPEVLAYFKPERI